MEESTLDNLLSENAALKKQLIELLDRRDMLHQEMLFWRGIDVELGDTPCPVCGGCGIRSYGDTTTWRWTGCGGQMMTSDVCDKCWGSGNAKKPWANLRKLSTK